MDAQALEIQKREVAYFMRRLYRHNLTTTSGGNISMRINEGHMLITPSSTDKGRMKGNEIGLLAFTGENLTTHLKLSMETGMHLAIYEKRPEIRAIIHAHPPVASAFTAMRKKINCALTAESRAILGTPGFATYALMGTEQLARIVAESALDSQVILMQNHGVICLGDNLLTAFDRMEVLEAAAKMTLITGLMHDSYELNPQQLREIDNLMAGM
jgi:L-fuculose-phosphate aldolase